MPNKRRIRHALIASAVSALLVVTVAPAANAAGNPFTDAAAACKQWLLAHFPRRSTHVVLDGPGNYDLAGGQDGGNPVWYGYEPIPHYLDNGGPLDQTLGIRQNRFTINYDQIEAAVRATGPSGNGDHIRAGELAIAETGGIRVYQGDRYIGNAGCG